MFCFSLVFTTQSIETAERLVLTGVCCRCLSEYAPAVSRNCSITCPVDCVVSAFTEWSACALTCIEGLSSLAVINTALHVLCSQNQPTSLTTQRDPCSVNIQNPLSIICCHPSSTVCIFFTCSFRYAPPYL